MLNDGLKFKIIKFFLIFLSFNAAFLSLNLKKAMAQQVSLGISPPVVEIVIKPGKSVLIAYNLENFGDPAIINTTVLPFSAKDEYGHTRLGKEFEGPIRFSLANSEIKLGQPFFIKSQDRQQLLLQIRAPEGTPEGDYYYTLLCQTQEPAAKEGTTTNRISASIGANILITVTDSGLTEIKGKINLFDVLARIRLKLFGRSINIFESGDKIPVVLVIKNEGKNLIKPQGEITLRGRFGEKADFTLNGDNVLAGAERLISASNSAEMGCPEEQKNSPSYCRQPVSLLIDGFFIGKYQLTTTVNFGEGTPNLYASTSFVALPFRLITGLIIASLMGSLIVKKIRHDERDKEEE